VSVSAPWNASYTVRRVARNVCVVARKRDVDSKYALLVLNMRDMIKSRDKVKVFYPTDR